MSERASVRRKQPETRSIARPRRVRARRRLQRTAGDVATARTLARTCAAAARVRRHSIHGALAHLKALGLPTDALDGIVEQLRVRQGRASRPSSQGSSTTMSSCRSGTCPAWSRRRSAAADRRREPRALFHELTHAFMHFHARTRIRGDPGRGARRVHGPPMRTAQPAGPGARAAGSGRRIRGRPCGDVLRCVQTLSSASAGELAQAVVDGARRRRRGMVVRVTATRSAAGCSTPPDRRRSPREFILERPRLRRRRRILANRFAEHFADDSSQRSFTA